jgi:hypothetical protein
LRVKFRRERFEFDGPGVQRFLNQSVTHTCRRFSETSRLVTRARGVGKQFDT